MRYERGSEGEAGDWGDRGCFAFLGAFFGLPMGLALLFLGFLLLPGTQPPVSIVSVTVGYCAVFGFLFGEDLADFLAMFGRLFALTFMFESSQVIVEPRASWFRPTVAVLSFGLLLALVVKLVLARAA
ncbi:hypothetical protein BURK2_00897 [Burkholderiales bacterium]|nr:hypothetical protein BURK2_00897 [Burkholderiales bacterium]